MTNIKDLALASGVSPATVSQVLNNGGRPVNAKTRERVLRAVAELDYRPNAVARALVLKRMNTIGLVFLHADTPAHSNPFLMMVLDGVLSVNTRQRQSTMLSTVESWETAERLPELSDGRCDGVLLLVPPTDCALPEFLRQRKIPVVVVGGHSVPPGTAWLDIDNIGAAREMTEYLLGLGHRRIAFVHKQREWMYPFAHERQEGYRQAMAAHGLFDTALAHFSFEDAAALDPMSPSSPTALFCAYDAAALELSAELRHRGIRIPEDVSIAGFDDIPEASACPSPLTTVRQPMTRIGEQAAEMLLSLIEGTDSVGRQEVLPTELVIRQSTAPCLQ